MRVHRVKRMKSRGYWNFTLHTRMSLLELAKLGEPIIFTDKRVSVNAINRISKYRDKKEASKQMRLL